MEKPTEVAREVVIGSWKDAALFANRESSTIISVANLNLRQVGMVRERTRNQSGRKLLRRRRTTTKSMTLK